VSDTFGDWWEDQEPEATPAGEQPLLADGKHNGRIVVAEVKDLAFKASDRNPAGKSLVVKVAVPGYAMAEDIVPVQFRGVIQAICRSVGQEPPAKGETFDDFTARLKGQSGPIESTLAVSGKGREYVRLKWLPGLPPAQEPAEPKAKVKPKAEPKPDLHPDDIPF
jgi:hypothetical protein